MGIEVRIQGGRVVRDRQVVNVADATQKLSPTPHSEQTVIRQGPGDDNTRHGSKGKNSRHKKLVKQA
jgi:hypothetical protein